MARRYHPHLAGIYRCFSLSCIAISVTLNDCMPATEVLATIFTIVSYMPLDYTEVGWARLLCPQKLDS